MYNGHLIRCPMVPIKLGTLGAPAETHESFCDGSARKL